MRASHRAHFATVAGCLASVAGSALAQQVDPALMATRRDTIQQAIAAAEGGDHVRALDLAQRAGEIAMSPSLRGVIAHEAAALGRWSLALGQGQSCVAEAERDLSVPDRALVLESCRSTVEQAAPRVGRVIVALPPRRPDGARVRVDGNELPPAVWGLPYVVTAGSIAVEVTAPGYAPTLTRVDVAEGTHVEVPVTWTATPAPPPVAAPVAAPVRSTPRTTAPPPSGPGAAPWIVVGGGAVGLGLAGLFLALGDRAYPACNDTAAGCPDSAEADHQRYATLHTAAGVSAWVGGAAVAGGLTWWLLARSRGGAATTAIGVVPTPGGLAVGYGRAF